MAQKRLVIDGYGQLELNNVAFRRDGRIEAQCALSTADFTDERPSRPIAVTRCQCGLSKFIANLPRTAPNHGIM